MALAWINGAQMAESEAAISINDRGFRFGDGVFETVPVHRGVPYLWEHHAERLTEGLKALRIPFDVPALLPQARALIASNKITHGLLRIQVTRGQGSQGYLPSGDLKPTAVMQTSAHLPAAPKAAALWLSMHEKISARALPVHCKLAQGLGSTLARLEAAEHGCFEALQLGQGGLVSEASSANIFWRSQGKLYTPSLACGALAGVTRRRILELSPYPVTQGEFALDRLMAADAVLLSNAALGAVAVHTLLPAGKTWNSAALAREINAIRSRDIAEYCKKHPAIGHCPSRK